MKFSAIISPAPISAAILEMCEVFMYMLQEYMKVRLYFFCLFWNEWMIETRIQIPLLNVMLMYVWKL
jgi:hypothetical protein